MCHKITRYTHELAICTMLCAKSDIQGFNIVKTNKKHSNFQKGKNEVQANLMTRQRAVVEFLLHIQRQFIYKSMALFNVFYSRASRVGLFSISQFVSVNFNKDVLLVLDTFMQRKFFTILVFISSTTFELKGLKLVWMCIINLVPHKGSQAYALFYLIMLCIRVVYKNKYTVVMLSLYFELVFMSKIQHYWNNHE